MARELRRDRGDAQEARPLRHEVLADPVAHPRAAARQADHDLHENSLHLHDGTYDGLVLQVLAPLMLRRIEVMHREIAECADLVADYEVCKRLRAAIGLGAP